MKIFPRRQPGFAQALIAALRLIVSGVTWNLGRSVLSFPEVRGCRDVFLILEAERYGV